MAARVLLGSAAGTGAGDVGTCVACLCARGACMCCCCLLVLLLLLAFVARCDKAPSAVAPPPFPPNSSPFRPFASCRCRCRATIRMFAYVSLSRLRALQVLDLCDNNVQDAGSTALAQCLASPGHSAHSSRNCVCPRLRQLDLEKNPRIGDDGRRAFERLGRGIRVNFSFQFNFSFGE